MTDPKDELIEQDPLKGLRGPAETSSEYQQEIATLRVEAYRLTAERDEARMNYEGRKVSEESAVAEANRLISQLAELRKQQAILIETILDPEASKVFRESAQAISAYSLDAARKEHA